MRHFLVFPIAVAGLLLALLVEGTAIHARPAAAAGMPASTPLTALQPITESVTTTVPLRPLSRPVLPLPARSRAAITATTTITAAGTLTGATPIDRTPSPTAGGETTLLPTPTPAVTVTEAPTEAVTAAPIVGTIVANRAGVTVQFFVEGQTYRLAPQRSLGFDLPRVTGVLNLYNCPADVPESEATCYWDPYLLNRDGFYEIVAGAEAGADTQLTLREAGAPATDQIWIQNRSMGTEVVVYRGETYELAPGTVSEFSAAGDAVPTFFVRNCIEAASTIVCEWTPVIVQPGIYYALVQVKSAGGAPDSTVTVAELQPVLGDAAADEAPESTRFLCRLQVPAVNVRSGPGLEYQIINKVRGGEQEPATVLVIGRDESGQWLAVDERVALGGWITASGNFLICDGDIAGLPTAEITDGRLAPTPTPGAAAVTAETSVPVTATTNVTGTAPTAFGETAPLPNGLARLEVNNAFDHEMRFTLDQRYRVELGASEFDLAPGGSTSILIYPGMIPFTASSAWSGLSGNDDFMIAAGETRTLWLIFVPDPDGSGRWILQY